RTAPPWTQKSRSGPAAAFLYGALGASSTGTAAGDGWPKARPGSPADSASAPGLGQWPPLRPKLPQGAPRLPRTAVKFPDPRSHSPTAGNRTPISDAQTV